MRILKEFESLFSLYGGYDPIAAAAECNKVTKKYGQ